MKAFIFDMDGVIVDSERSWDKNCPNTLIDLFGEKIANSFTDTAGISIDDIYEQATKMGAKMDRREYDRRYDQYAKIAYSKADITDGVDELAQNLVDMNIKLGLVTSSPRTWINMVLPRTKFANKLASIICMIERRDLRRKPHPDGYIEAMKELNADPSTTIILEDSNRGIKSAKASGAFVIGLRVNLFPDYPQEGADVYVDTMKDVLEIAKKQFRI